MMMRTHTRRLKRMKWRDISINGTMIQWDGPKIIEGKYLGAEERTTENGTNLVHSIKRRDGETVQFFGTTLLNKGLGRVAPGADVQVEYTGKTIKTRRFSLKEFLIRVGEDDNAPTEGNGRGAQGVLPF
jgi:hypothetical protein